MSYGPCGESSKRLNPGYELMLFYCLEIGNIRGGTELFVER